MRTTIIAALLTLAPAAAFAQKWEYGVTGGYGFLNNVNVTGAPGTATAGFAPGFVAGGFIGEDHFRHMGGEIRYEYMQSDLRLTSSGQTAQFKGAAHAIHYDLVFHTNRGESAVQAFVAIGGGVKAFMGRGVESASQPLSQYGYFTKTTSTKPMLTASVGFKARISSTISFRAEIRDYATQFPTDVLTPPPGVKYSRFLNELVPMVSIVFSK